MAKKTSKLSPLELEIKETKSFIDSPLSFYLIRIELMSLYERAYSRDHRVCQMVYELCESKQLDNPKKFVDYLNTTPLKDCPDSFKPVLDALSARLERLKMELVNSKSE